jgi:hypothetical protein
LVESGAVASAISTAVASKADQALLAPIETGTTASQSYSIGQQFVLNGILKRAKAAIAVNETFTDSNCENAPSVTEQLKGFVPYKTVSRGGNLINTFNQMSVGEFTAFRVEQQVTGFVSQSEEGIALMFKGASAWGTFLALSNGKVYRAAFSGTVTSSITWTQIT